jgi:hypothetical protein
LPDGVECRFGLGIGAVDGFESASGRLQDGPGWWAARAAIDTVHAKQQRAAPSARTWVVASPDEDAGVHTAAALANSYLLARDHLVGGMNERARRLTLGRCLGRTQRDLAQEEGITQPAVSQALAAIVVAALWVWLAPIGGRARAGFWPAVVLAVLCAALVVTIPARSAAGVIADGWELATPFGSVGFDHIVLVVGTVVFLMESANVVVRTALQQEAVQLARVAADAVSADPAEGPRAVPADSMTDASSPADTSGGAAVGAPAAASVDETPVAASVQEPPAPASVDEAAPLAVEPALKGGRLIGPLERVLVFALTLAAMYPLLAAVLAAKGIVRFPEISRDSAAGNRAEYFLIGSLVSWVIALAGALLVWWAFATP